MGLFHRVGTGPAFSCIVAPACTSSSRRQAAGQAAVYSRMKEEDWGGAHVQHGRQKENRQEEAEVAQDEGRETQTGRTDENEHSQYSLRAPEVPGTVLDS